MSQVSDAMRRAGELEEPAPISDMPFTMVDGSHADSIDDVVAQSQREEGSLGQRLPARARSAPIDLKRRESNDDVRIADVVRILNRHLWLMAAVVVLAVAAAAVYNRTVTPIYEARARLLLESNSPEVVPFRTMTEDQGRLDYYITQIEVLRSRELARRTLERLKMTVPDSARQSGQISQVLGRLAVAPVRTDMGESRVITVSYKDPDPEMAAKLANGFSQTYVEQNLDSRRQGSRDAFEWLNQRMDELRREVTTREDALQRYRQQKDSVSLGDQQNIVVQKLAQLNTAVTAARTERVEREALYEQLNAIEKSGAALDTFSPIMANTFIQGLKTELATLQRQRNLLSEQLGELHPDMIKVNTSIANVQQQLKNEMAKVVDGVQNDYRAARAKEQGLNTALEEQKQEVLQLSQKSIGYTALQRDAASTQQMFETVRQRVKETELAGELQSNNAKILDLAEVPRSPISPRVGLNFIVAALGGVFLALLLAFTVEYLNPRLEKPSEIAEALGLPLLGIAPVIPGLKNRTASLEELPPSFREAFRTIRTRILLSPIAATARTMAVTSTTPKEGKTIVASNLAVSMAMAGKRVLLVDADLHRPQVHRIFNIPRSPGLSEILSDNARPSETLHESPVPRLFILAAGGTVERPGDLLDSERLHQLISGLGRVFDVVVMDCPPVMAVADASIIGHAASSVLFVVGSGTTSRESAQLALDRLAAVQVQMLGVVVNKAKKDKRHEYGYEVALSEDVA